ncbi:MAG TPA: glycosyltransferase family 39 protein [Solirubrobacteraceae bacterium]
MTERRVFGGLLAAALVASLLVPTYPNYDSYWALVWGREILDGAKPSFDAPFAPTEHPLWTLHATLLDLLFGGVADRALVISCVIAFVALVWATYRVGRACFSPLSGAVAALCVGSSFAFLLYAARGYVDVPFLALVLWAAALEAERPRRGLPVAVLLALAGLLRPEAWLLAGAYWLWCAWPLPAGRRRPELLGLAVAAPALWLLTDLVVTGDALFSLHSTSALAEDLGRTRGIENVPGKFVSFLADTTRAPVFAAGLAGAALAWWRRDQLRALHVPLALFAGGTVAFAGSGALGLSILPRYLTVPAVAMCLLAGWAVGSFGRRGAVVALVIGLAFVAIRIPSFTKLRNELRFIGDTHAAVAAMADDPALRACRPVTLPTYRLVPDFRFELDSDAVLPRTRGAALSGGALFVVGDKPVRRFGKADGIPRGTNDRPPIGTPTASHGFLRAYGDCGAAS